MTPAAEKYKTIRGAARKVVSTMLVLWGLVGISACRPASPPTVDKRQPPNAPFREINVESAVNFVHSSGAQGQKLLPESMGGGCGFLDVNNDGRQDLILLNGAELPGDSSRAPSAANATGLVLYLNQGDGRYRKASGHDLATTDSQLMGLACGDYDNDGWVDVFVSAVGGNYLLHNEQGTLRDVTDQAGVGGDASGWSTSCGWLDIDNDRDLDLFVCNYLDWSADLDQRRQCMLPNRLPAYCPPTAFAGTFPYLYVNQGDGTFRERAGEAGLQVRVEDRPAAKSLGLAPVDLDRDGWIDIVVANDTVRNFVFHNQRDGTFREMGAEAGIAFDDSGNVRGAMGIDSGCFRNDDKLGLAIGNFADEMTGLYVMERPLQFRDNATALGLGPHTLKPLTFGLFWFDFDLDGRLDLLSANGHLEPHIQSLDRQQRYAQSAQLFWNAGADQAREFIAMGPDQVGPDFVRPLVGRGAAFADIDGDGDSDVLLAACGQAARLLRNDQATDHHWIRFKLIGRRCNRDAIGSWITLQRGAQKIRRQVMPTRSYLSQVELPVSFGLGSSPQIDQVLIEWSSGHRQVVEQYRVDQLNIITES